MLSKYTTLLIERVGHKKFLIEGVKGVVFFGRHSMLPYCTLNIFFTK